MGDRIKAIFCAAVLLTATCVFTPVQAATPSQAITDGPLDEAAAQTLAKSLLDTIAVIPAGSKEPVYESQLAGVINSQSLSRLTIIRAITLARQKICTRGGAGKAGALVCKPSAAGRALLYLLSQRLKTRALGNGSTPNINGPNFNGGGGGSNYSV